MDIHQLDAYEIIEEKTIADVDSTGYLLRHKKSGARVAILSNDDSNKVFYIGFKTPPQDGCGVPHIIEHTVLCGSEKFPAKDPFVELIKGSLNTFLNAMTYPDKTVYPIASYNQKDFENLMDVYLDAVFHPNITRRQEIFMQEGWHYELESADAPLTINGVVYNEMKGAYSSPNELLMTQISNSLFPDNTYSCNSGGDPKQIPQLTYETYLDFYRKHYHPSNSYIYLYGDMDVAERLDWMDREYLCQYDAADVDSQILPQEPFAQMTQLVSEYPIASDEPEEDRTYLSYNMVIGTILDPVLYQAMNALDYALISAPGAPIRQALIDAGIGEDVYSIYDTERQQPVFSIVAKNANASDQERFTAIIREELEKLVTGGVNHQSLLAAINSEEFRFREADFGNYPKGLLYGLQCLDSWIFDENHPFLQLECLDIFSYLRKQLDTGFYEELIQRYLLDNTHGSLVMVVPKKGANQQDEEELQRRLADYKASLADEEIEALVQQTAHLKAYQEEPSTDEELRKIPLLKREDLKREAEPFSNIEESISEVPVVRHDVEANGIDYLTLMFDAGDVEEEQLALLGLLGSVLGYVDTGEHSYLELANEINIYTGGINGSVGVYPCLKEDGQMTVKFEFAVKVLEDNLPKAMELVQEILLKSSLEDTKRLQEIFTQVKAGLQSSLSRAGHVAAANRAMSHSSRYAYYQDMLHGIAYYQNVTILEQRIRTQPQQVIAEIKELVERIFVKNRLMISFTADEAAYTKAIPAVRAITDELPMGAAAQAAAVPSIDRMEDETGGTPYREGFCDASQIQYVARAGNFAKHGYSYSGYLSILKMILEYDYLWMNLRVLGGAYGCMSRLMRGGEVCFVSYRDPNLARTNEVYERIPEYLRSFAPDERDMTKYIIGTFGSMDIPLYPEGKGSRSMNAYLQGVTFEQIQKERDEILKAAPEDIRALADLTEAVLSDGQLCVVGNENAIRREEALFDRISGLYQAEETNE